MSDRVLQVVKDMVKVLFTATGQTAFTSARGLGTTQSFIIPASTAVYTGSVASIAAGGY